MTSQTRNDLLNLLDRATVAPIDQAIMDAWLSTWPSREEYEREAIHHGTFYAVLATEEYHQHWESIANSGKAESGALNRMALELVERGDIAGDAEYLRNSVGASTVTETPFDSRFERVVK